MKVIEGFYSLLGYCWLCFTGLIYLFAMVIVPGLLIFFAFGDRNILAGLFGLLWLVVGLGGLYKMIVDPGSSDGDGLDPTTYW